jgi:hypothetical protein
VGNYNPHRPTILGQEWVGIREEPYPVDQTVERGYTFVLDTSTTVVSGSYFIDELPPNSGTKAANISVYRTGEEARSGPVKKVIIPVNNVVLTPDGANGSFNLFGGNTAVQSVANSADGSFIVAQGDITIEFNFATNSFSAVLSGKRILDVNILYVIPVSFNEPEKSPGIGSSIYGPAGTEISYGDLEPTSESPYTIQTISRIGLGNTNLWLGALDGAAGSQRYPWRYPDLQRFENGAANELTWVVEMGSFGPTPTNAIGAYLSYVAMEIVYCEETRLLYGAKGAAILTSGTYVNSPILGQNIVHLRSSDTFTSTGTILTPGEYTVTTTLAYLGNNFLNIGGNPSVRALRQTYALPSHQGVQLDISTTEGQTIRRSEIDVIPQIALHTASATVTGVHAFGQLVLGNIYNAVEVSPDILQRSGGAAVPYPQVRFYARRFGDTATELQLQSTTQPTWLVRITPNDLDALPEVVDGWREVTLRFPDAATPTFGNVNAHTWEWTATGLDAGAQWQVLVPRGESLAVAPYDTDVATYGGVTAFTTVTNQVLSNSADGVLIFSQDPPAVTGLAVEVAEQSLEPVGEECAVEPRCVPTALYYHHVTWDAQDVLDTFNDRETVNGWGDAESGQTWSHVNGSVDDYYVSDDAGVQRVDTINVIYFSVVDARAYNVEVRTRFRLPVLPIGAGISVRAEARFEDSSNYYEALLSFNTDGTVQLLLGKRVGGTGVTISPTPTLDSIHVAGDVWNIVFRTQGDQLLSKAWKDETPEPLGWQVTAVAFQGDSVTGTQVAVGVRAETGNLNTPFELEWLEFSAINVDMSGFELQRQDDVDNEWQTIMRSTGLAVAEFNDYEARIGVESRYRARTVNVLEFYGAWTASGAVASILTSPGVVGVDSDGNSVLVFTTNERQDGSSNLAYVMTWDGDVTEEFTFRETGSVQLRELYRRDFPVAFRPLERGGESFSRDILVQNAAVPTGRVRDGFTSLRDMAWADVSYVCVRDELGDRWFATVLVPSGRVRRNRRLYVARVDVIETSETPSAVDPTEVT